MSPTQRVEGRGKRSEDREVKGRQSRSTKCQNKPRKWRISKEVFKDKHEHKRAEKGEEGCQKIHSRLRKTFERIFFFNIFIWKAEKEREIDLLSTVSYSLMLTKARTEPG